MAENLFRLHSRVPLAHRRDNRLLAAMERSTRERLEPFLNPVELGHGEVICHAGASLDHAYFPTGAVLSLRTVMRNGAAIETAKIGAEGAFGFFAAIDGQISFNQCHVDLGGPAIRVPIVVLRAELAQSEPLRILVASYGETLLAQVQQTVACNTAHHVSERLCRWLLTSHDRAGRDDLASTHEFLAGVLGVDRKSITLAAQSLQRSGLINYTRGTIRIVDRAGLEASACECYAIIRERYDVFEQTAAVANGGS